MTDSEEDYEEIRRRKVEERRQKREADRQKRRQRSTGMIRRDWSSASASASAGSSASTSVQSSVTKGTGANKSARGFVSSNKSNTCTLNEYKSDSRTRTISSSTKASTSISSTVRSRTVAPPSASKSTLASASNGRDDRQSRIEKLKEKKRAEEGLRLIQEMYGTTYMNDKDLMRDDDDDDDDDDSDGRNNHGKRTNVTKDKGKGQGKGKAVMNSNSPNQKDYVYKNSPRNNYVASSIMSKVQSDPTAWTSTKSKSASASAFISKSNSKLSPPKSSTPTPPSARTYTYKQNQYNNDSSSDDDLVTLATNLQKQKESQSQSRLLSRVRSRSTSAPISTSVSSTSTSTSTSKSKSMVLSPKEGSGVSKMPTARRKGKDLDQGDTRGDSSNSGGDDSCKNIMLSSKKRRSDYMSDDDDDDDDDDGDDFDLMAYSRKIKRKRSGKRTPEKEECPDQEMSMSTPGNRNRDDRMDGVDVAAVKHFPAVDLWSSDSDQDERKEVGIQSARMRRRKKGKLTAEGDSDDDDGGDDDDFAATNHKSENVKRGEAGSKRRGRKIRTESSSDKRKYQRSFLELESDAEEFELDDDDSALEKQLKPTFENPKWLNELVPFSLPKSVDSQDENGGTPVLDQVPAAINRYLKDYQQEGVRFLHSLVTRGLGAVLGDDMGKWFIIFCCVFLSIEYCSVRSTISPYHYIVQTCNCAIFVL